MYWADLIAEKIIQRNPQKEEYVCAAGISPSGSIHIGNFRDIATSYMVALALQKKGKKTKLLFSWDNFDRLRKVPANVQNVVANNEFEQYIGMPYTDVPDPFGTESNYAEHFQNEFLKSFKNFGIEMSFRSQTDEYRSGRYAEKIVLALKRRKEIFDILDKHRTQTATPEERENYYPVSIYCPCCHKDSTHITSLSEDCTTAEYTCECGHKAKINFLKDFYCKLSWKTDWAMRWSVEGVDFEPGGKDHASLHGSYAAAKEISKRVFDYPAPIFQGYEFIGIKGNVNVGKMSGSSGLNMTPEFLLQLYQPEVILWLYAKTEPLKAFDFCLSDEILRQYFEFDKMLSAYQKGVASDAIARIMENCKIKGREVSIVPMSQLVDLGAVVDFNPDMMQALFAKIGTPYKKEEFIDRLNIAKFWLRTCAPENEYIINAVRNWSYFESLDEKERLEIKLLHDFLTNEQYDMEALKSALYAIPKQVYPEALENEAMLKNIQSTFFKHVYNLLISRDKGPRLYLYLYAVDLTRYINLLDFSMNKEDDKQYQDSLLEAAKKLTEETEHKKEIVQETFVASPLPIKPQITIDDFTKLDLRVCKVKSCKAVRKTNNLYSIIVQDGIGERTIVASIAADYSAEELIGKKVIVLVNLEPHKFGNTISNGMLLAAVNEDNTSSLISVDDKAQIGTVIK